MKCTLTRINRALIFSARRRSAFAIIARALGSRVSTVVSGSWIRNLVISYRSSENSRRPRRHFCRQISPGPNAGRTGIRANRKFYREQSCETFLYISGRAFIGARSRNVRPLINAGIEQTGNRLEQKAPPRTFFHLSNFSHYREISLLLFLPFALDPQTELPPCHPSASPLWSCLFFLQRR